MAQEEIYNLLNKLRKKIYQKYVPVITEGRERGGTA
jgi:hypothetical protein